jgi:hypothetical protein
MSTKPKKTLTDDVRRRFARGEPVGTGRPDEAPQARLNGPTDPSSEAKVPVRPGPTTTTPLPSPTPAPAAPTPAATAEPDPGRLNQSYRLPKPLVLRLQQVGLRRKHAHQKPWSGQDIVAEALTRWLDEEEKRATP